MSIVFVCTQLNVKAVLFQTIQFSKGTVSMSKIVMFQTIQFYISTRFSSIRPIDKTLSGATNCVSLLEWLEWTLERWQCSGTLYSPNLQHYWSLTIGLLTVISRTLVGGVLPLCREVVSVFYSPSRLGNIYSRSSSIYIIIHGQSTFSAFS